MKTCLGCFNLDYNKSGSAKNCHDDTIWYRYYLIMGIEFHVFIQIIHVVIQTSASDWVPESDVCKRVRDLTLAVTDTFLANLTSNVWQCWQGSQVWNREPNPFFSSNEESVSFPINQSGSGTVTHSQLGTLEDLSAEDDALSLSLTTWILWIHYTQPWPTLINTSPLLWSIIMQSGVSLQHRCEN